MLVKEKCAAYGSDRLSEQELLSILLGITEAASEKILNACGGNIRKLHDIPHAELTSIKEIGKDKALRIKVLVEFSKRFNSVEFKVRETLSSCRQVFAHFNEKLKEEKKEKFYVLLLDCKNRLIKEELVSIGSLNFSIVHPREIFNAAIRESAANVVLVHNHPSGDPTPSQEDINVTTRLFNCGKLVGIEVFDHVVIGENCYVSFSEQNIAPFCKNS